MWKAETIQPQSKEQWRHVTVETHGFGMPETMWAVIDKAYRSQGIIVFTDPDYAGEKIRRKITAKYPDCKQAFLPRAKR